MGYSFLWTTNYKHLQIFTLKFACCNRHLRAYIGKDNFIDKIYFAIGGTKWVTLRCDVQVCPTVFLKLYTCLPRKCLKWRYQWRYLLLEVIIFLGKIMLSFLSKEKIVKTWLQAFAQFLFDCPLHIFFTIIHIIALGLVAYKWGLHRVVHYSKCEWKDRKALYAGIVLNSDATLFVPLRKVKIKSP